MPVPLDQYIDPAALERRISRDLAHRIGEAVDAAKIALTDAFCGDAFDVDVNGEPVLRANAEAVIDNALSPIWTLQDELERKGGRTS
jgi:hypothetical protein